jgi:uncharacterized membrane protein
MKKAIFSLSIAAMFAVACNNNPKTETSSSVTTDTTNRTQLDNAAAMEMNGVSDTIVGSDGQVYIKAKPNAPTVMEETPAPARTVKSTVKSAPIRKKTTTTKSSTGTGGTSTSTSTSSTGTASTGGTTTGTGTDVGTTTTTTQTPPVVEEKKGWSGAAKGTAIGAATGAAAGAIISKNKGLGAVIGGVAGAAGGYIIGKKKDKKKAAEQNQTTDQTTTNP